MRKLLLTIAILATALGPELSGNPVRAADLRAHGRDPSARAAIGVRCVRRWICAAEGCSWQKFCPVGCPDGYSCSPLYGAYGPYGGTGYWGAYTSVGWGRY
jgi:hypothetical protein